MSGEEVPAWFSDAILEGVSRLYVLGLAGTPGADTIARTHSVWVEVLWHGKQWHEERDVGRIDVAFQQLMQRVDRWPSPAQLLEALPRAQTPPALPVRMSEEQRRANREYLDELLKGVMRSG